MKSADQRIPVAYLAPWVDIGGSDTSTIDWFRFLDRGRFAPSLITTQPSPNRRLVEVVPYAEEVWELPQLISGDEFPRFILSFIHTRGIRLLHIMNSRLGFELLPDIAALPDRPQVVVQFHGEEPRHAGYVRYVTTRYGNLVDAFSMTTERLSKRLEAYDVPIGKRRLIPIGVDAEREFSPDRVEAIQGLDETAFQILFAARLTSQKDPLLMVDVATHLRTGGLRFQIQVLGDGELMQTVRERVVDRGLERHVLLHGARADVSPWYAACDAALLTSEYETSPTRVAYETMAMALPLIAPDMPELRELVIPGTGVLVRPRADAAAYAGELRALADDQPTRQAIGEAARARVRSGFSLERMASEHQALYEELLSATERNDRPATRSYPEPAPARVAFRSRQPGAKPLVSVIVTCFNQGRYLNACLRSVARQTYPSVETIVVDDGSTESETLAALAIVERERTATVVRLPANRGPAGARNAGLEHARGRYVIPLDGDDLLVETAIADLAEQLGSAGEQMGFVYPNLQFFGNRNDYVAMPSYNLHALLTQNHCAASALIDREVFDRGFRYPEEIKLGHEDWDFALTLAEHGIYGEVARTRTLLCRKRGFTRSELVEAKVAFREVLAARHPVLLARGAELKGEWNPALTLIGLDPISENGGDPAELVTTASHQTCSDFELIIRSSRELSPTELGRRLRRVPSELAASRAQALADGLELSRGRYALATYGSPAELLANPALIEQALRILGSGHTETAIALADSGFQRPPLQLLDGGTARQSALRAFCWRTTGAAGQATSLSLAQQRPLEALARWLGAHVSVQWRHMHRRDGQSPAGSDDGPHAALGAPRHLRPGDAGLRNVSPALPECPPGVPHRLASISSWRPPQSRLLCRHRRQSSGGYAYTNSMAPPEGYVLDQVLGCLREYPLPGTASLLLVQDETAFAVGQPTDLGNPKLLGFIEQQALPLFDSLVAGPDPGTGDQILAAGRDDPVAPSLETATVIGYVEPHPIHPRLPAHSDIGFGLAGLVRTVDLKARRHRYGAGFSPPGLGAGELGALFAEPTGDCDPLWIDDDGYVLGAGETTGNGRPSLRAALHWTGDPLTWRKFSRPIPKLRASARRAVESGRLLTVRPRANGLISEPAGYLLRSPTSNTVPLHVALHPVTRDQLLSTDPSEAASLGYRDMGVLGYLVARAPVTGKLGPIRPGTPWAVRFGQAALGS